MRYFHRVTRRSEIVFLQDDDCYLACGRFTTIFFPRTKTWHTVSNAPKDPILTWGAFFFISELSWREYRLAVGPRAWLAWIEDRLILWPAAPISGWLERVQKPSTLPIRPPTITSEVDPIDRDPADCR